MNINRIDNDAAQPTDSAGMPVPPPSRQGGQGRRGDRSPVTLGRKPMPPSLAQWRALPRHLPPDRQSFWCVLGRERTQGRSRNSTRSETAFGRAVSWLLPPKNYAGRLAVLGAVIERPKQSIYNWRLGHAPVPTDIGLAVADIVERDARRGLEIADELRAEIAAHEAAPKRLAFSREAIALSAARRAARAMAKCKCAEVEEARAEGADE